MVLEIFLSSGCSTVVRIDGNLSEYIDSDEFKKEYVDWIGADAFGRDP